MLKKLSTVLLVIACCFITRPIKAAAASKTLYKSYDGGSKSYSSYDITGDGKADLITIKAQRDGDSIKTATITVNNVYKYTFNRTYDMKMALDDPVLKVTWFRLANGKPYLYVDFMEFEGEGMNVLLQFKNKKLVKVFDFQTYRGLQKTNDLLQGYFKKVSGNQLYLDCCMINNSIGVFEYNLKLRYSSGSFIPVTTQLSIDDEIRYVIGETALTSLKTKTVIQTYKSAGSKKKKAFKIPKGVKNIKFQKFYLGKNTVWFKVKYNSKTGWFPSATAENKHFTNVGYEYYRS